MNHNLMTMRASDGSVIRLECHDALPSTAKLAREYAKLGYPDRYVVFSEIKQKSGFDEKLKGESDRGIYMSCILRPSIFPSQAALLSSMCAVAITTALEEHTTQPIGIGWVSKIYCNNTVIGDVNIEGKLDNFTSYEYIIVNISLTLSEANFPPRLTDLLRKVFESENTSIPIIIAKNILNKFFSFYPTLKNSTKFMDIYRQKFILRGQKVKYLTGGRKQSCKVLGIKTDDSSLIVEDKNKKVVYISTPNKVTIPKKISNK